ncbi:MAG: MATE family efflux transporter [Bacteroidales bacterium]|nr:MATE family efflux transporter [Bacteroidales bacterium]
MNREILRLALPSIITNLTVPLLGMVDVAIIGHISDARGIAAIALGTMIFNLIYWNFGFLRMGTSGLTAQAYGAEDRQEYLSVLVQGLTIAGLVALTLIVLQYPIGMLSQKLIHSSEETIQMTLTYFYIRIWAAPANLGLYVLKGWFIGMQNAKTPMWIAIALNLVNIVCSLLFVYVFDYGIAGIAWGTVIAQYSGLTAAIIIWFIQYGDLWKHIQWRESVQWHKMIRFFKVNADIFLRSLCLIAVFTFIPYISGDMGDEILAANTLLLQLFTLLSYIMDGFAYAGESLVGRFVGARNDQSLHLVIRRLLIWGVALAALFTIAYALFGRQLLGILTNKKEVIDLAMEYIVWTVLVPFTGFAAFIYDGIYIGATASKGMRNIMFVATGAFFLLYFILQPLWGNHGLWCAFIVFLTLRGALMLLCEKKYVMVENRVKS